MVIQLDDQERVRTLLREAIPMMCRSGLQFKNEFHIEALVGITLDEDVFLVSIKESFKEEEEEDKKYGDSSEEENIESNQSDTAVAPPSNRAKRKRKYSQDSSGKKAKPDQNCSSDSDSEERLPQRTESQAVHLEETSLDTMLDINQTLNNSAMDNKCAHNVKQELQDEDDDSNELVFIKDEPGLLKTDYGGGSVGGPSFAAGSASSTMSASYNPQFALPSGDNSLNIDNMSMAGPSGLGDMSQMMPQAAANQDAQQVQRYPFSMIHRLHPRHHIQSNRKRVDPSGHTSASAVTHRQTAPPPYPAAASSHFEDRGATCTICGTYIKQKRNLKEHMKYKHSTARHTCNICGVSFKWFRTLKVHRRALHKELTLVEIEQE